MSQQEATKPQEERVLVLAPLGRDASLLCQTLMQDGLNCTVCSETDLRAELALGVGVLLLTEEALASATTLAVVRDAVKMQPEWSDLPLVLLVNASWQGLDALRFAPTATVLERPTRIPTLVTVTRSALMARRRQYQVRDLLQQQEDLNQNLEQRVEERTQDLARSEQRFSQAFNANPISATISTLDQEVFLEVNDAFLTLTGYTREEVVGKSAFDLKMWSSRVDQRMLQAAQKNARGFRDLELHLRHKDGTPYDVLLSAEVIGLEGTEGYLKMFYDITERKRTEMQMHQAIQSLMNDATWFSSEFIARLNHIRAGGDAEDFEQVALSRRERQVLECIASGWDNNKIASELKLQLQTVRNYVTHLYEKIDVHNRAEAVVWARERGIQGR